MAYAFNSKNKQKIGDLVSSEDPQGNTLIDFGDDRIDFVVSGTVVASIIPNQFSASLFIGEGSLSSEFFGGQFGDSSDGDLTVVGTFTAAKEMHFNNLTIPSGSTFKPNGHRIFVANTLTIESEASFHDDGVNGISQAGGAALASRNYLVASTGKGGNGVALTAIGSSNGGNGNGSTNSSLNNLGQSTNGGKGGNTTLNARTGGTGGSSSQPLYSQKWNGVWQTARWSGGGFGGGAGGGGGAINVTAHTSGIFSSGAGGSGGGIVWISAKNIINNGRISANGGNGSNGILAFGTAECCGGGGGGGGNVCIITKTASSSLGIVQANGGLGGSAAWNTGTGAVAAGSNGVSGSICIVVLN